MDMTEIKSIQNTIVDLKLLMMDHGKDLKEHMRRTQILESHVTILNRELAKLKTLYMVLGWIFAFLGVIASPLLGWWLKNV